MRVLHVSTARTWRGGEQQLAYLVGELQRLDVECHVFCPANSPLDRYCTSVSISATTFNRRSPLHPSAARELSRLCREVRFDLIHMHDSHGHTLYCLAATLFGLRTPAVVSRRVDFPVSGFLSRWKYNHPGVRAIVCVSERIREIMAPVIVDRSRLHVVRSGIDLGKFGTGDEKRLRGEFAIEAWRPIVANVAAIAPHKDYATFVNAAGRLVREGSDAIFLIIGGDGGEEVRIRGMIEEKGLGDRILLTGFRDDVPEILPEIDVLLFTSRTEGLGTTILDAFAAGTPVVATAAGGIPELVRDGETGLLAPVGDVDAVASHVKRLLADPDLERHLTAGAAAFVQEFSKERTAARTAEIYSGIVK